MNLDHGYLTIARISGDPAQLLPAYRRSAEVMSGVDRDHGLVVHVAAGTDEGMVLVNLWPSRKGSESAARDPRRVRALEAAGLTPEQIRREHHRVVEAIVFENN